MPRNKVSNDLDYVRQDPKPKTAPKGPPPEPKQLLKYISVKIRQPYIDGQGNLPAIIALNNSYVIFNLFFDESTLKILV